MNAWLSVGPALKRGAAAETTQRKQTKTVHKNMSNRKRMCSKLSPVLAPANFQQKKQKFVDF